MPKKCYVLLTTLLCVIFFLPSNIAWSQNLSQTPELTPTLISLTLAPEFTPTPTPNIPATVESSVLTRIAPTKDFRQPIPSAVATTWARNNERLAEEHSGLKYLVFVSLAISLIALLISLLRVFTPSSKKTHRPTPLISPPVDWKTIVLILFAVLPIIGLIIGFIIFLSIQK